MAENVDEMVVTTVNCAYKNPITPEEIAEYLKRTEFPEDYPPQ